MGWISRLWPRRRGGGFMSRLGRDRAGNVLAIMAAALIPMLALTGSAVDMARLYVVKVRLQQACDAGVLAGRKTMDPNGGSTLDANATAQATTFFNNNFVLGYMGTTFTPTLSIPAPFIPTKTSDNQVQGQATTMVPMTLMKMFGQSTQTLTVNCQARFDVADSDVMFVLDNTGSMACGPADPDSCGQPTVQYTRPDGTTDYKVQEKSNARIVALRSAVLSFYDTVETYRDPTTHFRYGFVPYTSTVNVGYSLPSSALVTQWNYQTRHVVGDHIKTTISSATVSASSLAACQAYYSRSPALTVTTKPDGTQITNYSYSTTGTATAKDPSWNASKNICTLNTDTVTPIWRYQQWPLDVSQYVTGATVDDPSKVTAATSKWQGCIEERNTTATMTFDQSNLPPDLDPDLSPAADVDVNGFPTANDTRWRPMWPEVLYNRGNVTTRDDFNSQSSTPYGDNGSYWNLPAYYGTSNYSPCPKPAQRLTTMSRTDVSAYLNAADFVPWGGTYHDTGMTWGLRMIAPSGPFASDTAAWAGRNPPNRYIVFMTDGHMSTSQGIYGLWAWENYDKRVTGGDFSNSDAYHNARFLAECTAAKNRNIKVYVVSVATVPDSTLSSCASPNSLFFASDAASLTTAFQTIAKQVAMLRISQ